MNTSRYIITTQLNGRDQIQTWDTQSPLMLGRSSLHGPLWVLEKTVKGKLRVRALSANEGQVVDAESKVFTVDQIKKGAEAKFKSGESELKLTVKPLDAVNVALARETESADLSLGYRVYECVGDWNTKISAHKSIFKAVVEGQDIFTVQNSGNTVKIKPHHPDLVLETSGQDQAVGTLTEIELSTKEFFKTSAKLGIHLWHFSAIAKSKRERLFEISQKDTGENEFKKYSALALLLLFLLGGLTKLIPESEEEVIPPQIVKVLVQPKKKREMPGERVEQADKPLAMSEQTQANQPKDLIVPKGNAGKKLDKQQQQRINKIQNLYSGLMRGGLNKILDSKALMETSKIGNASITKVQGDTKTLTAAMQNLSVNINAGNTDSKVSGFGGTMLAGVKGPNTVGYADGVKGGILSGTGGSRISLGDSDADVEEGLTKEEVGRVIHEHMKEVRYCYEDTMLRQAQVDGKVVIAFMINGRGVVAKANIESSSIDRTPASDSKLGQCIVRRLKTWQFPLPKGGVNVNVSYPFIFKTLGGK